MKPVAVKHLGKVEYGFEKCPIWLKDKYREAVNFICQDCKKNEKEVGKLEPHRINRGVEGGLYMAVPFNHVLSNVKMCCHSCHEKYNYSRRLDY